MQDTDDTVCVFRASKSDHHILRIKQEMASCCHPAMLTNLLESSGWQVFKKDATVGKPLILTNKAICVFLYRPKGKANPWEFIGVPYLPPQRSNEFNTAVCKSAFTLTRYPNAQPARPIHNTGTTKAFCQCIALHTGGNSLSPNVTALPEFTDWFPGLSLAKRRASIPRDWLLYLRS